MTTNWNPDHDPLDVNLESPLQGPLSQEQFHTSGVAVDTW